MGRQSQRHGGQEEPVLEADEAADIQEVQAWAAGLDALHARIAGRFVRAEPRRRALAYLRGLLGNVGPIQQVGWQLAEHAGERTPDGMQRLLASADWDPDRARDDLRAYVVEHLGDAGAGRAVDRLQRRPRRQGPPPVRLDPHRACHPGHDRHGQMAAGAPPQRRGAGLLRLLRPGGNLLARLGSYQEHRPARPWEQPAPRCKQCSVGGLQAGPWMLAAQHRKLVA
jgi:hypothetical protein